MKQRNLKLKAMMCILFFAVLFLSLPLFRITAKAGGAEYGIWVGDTQFTDTCTEIKDAAGTGTATYDHENNTVTFKDFNGVATLHDFIGYKYQFYTNMDGLKIKGNAVFDDYEDDGTVIRDYYEHGVAFGGIAGIQEITFDQDADIKIRTYGYGMQFHDAKMTVNGKLDIKTDGETNRSAIECNEYVDSADAQVTAVTTKLGSAALKINSEARIKGSLTAKAEFDGAKNEGESSKAIFLNTGSEYTSIVFYEGCQVTATAGKYATAVYSNANIQIYNCDINASGGKAAFAADRGSITMGDGGYIHFPEAGRPAVDTKSIVDAQGSVATKVVVKKVEWYDLWIGGERINEETKDNISGIIGGTASYDPIGKTLDFSGNVTGIEGDNSGTQLIHTKTDLTIQGDAKLITDEENYAIYAEGSIKLTIDGNLTVKSAETGIYGDNADLVINGKLTAGTYSTGAVYAGNIIVSKNAVFDASTSCPNGYAIYANNALIVDGGTVTATADAKDAYAVQANNVNVNGGKVSASVQGIGAYAITGDVYLTDGQVTADSTLKGSYGLAGNLYIKNGAFTALSTGKTAVAIAGSVEQYGGKITAVADGEGAQAYSGNLMIWGGSMEAEVKNCKQNDCFALQSSDIVLYGGNLTVRGSDCGILCDKLEIYGGMLSVSAQKEYGIYVNDKIGSDVIMTAGSVKTTGSGYGIYCMGKAEISGGTLTAEGKKAAVWFEKKDPDTIDLKEDAKILMPANGKTYNGTSPDYTTVVAGDETTPAQSVTIQGTGVYLVWVGKHQVTDKNKANIEGISGGKASYDPATATLTFTGDGSGSVDDVEGVFNNALICADGNLTIKGKAKLSGSDYGIYVLGNLTVEGSVTVKAASNNAVYAGALKVPGYLNASSTNETAVYTEDFLTVPEGGQLIAVSQTIYGIYVYDSAKIEGTVSAEGLDTGLYINGVKDTAISGTLNAKGESCGLYQYDSGNISISGTVSASGGDTGIYMNDSGDLNISGTVTAEGETNGVYMRQAGTLNITGILDAKSTTDYAVLADGGDIIMNGSRLTAYSEKSVAIGSAQDMKVLNGTLEARTGVDTLNAVYAGWAIQIGEDMRITLPVGGKVEDSGSYVVEADGTKLASHVKIEHIPVYKVSFQTNGHGNAVSTQTVNQGSKASKPADPSETCHIFGGWFTDAACTAAYNFDAAVTKDITLYAKWTPAHSLNAVPAKEAAQGVPGNSAYYVCSKCGKYFSDAAGTKEIAKDSWVIEAKAAGQNQGGQSQGGQNGETAAKSDKENSPYKDLPDVTKVSTPKKGEKYTDEANGAVYQAVKSGKSIVLIYLATISKETETVSIPATVKIGKKKYKVTQIAPNAFKGCKKLKKVTIGKSIKKIGKKAFFGCSALKKITIKTTSLTKKNVGANAFKGIHTKAQIKVPAGKLSAYRKVLKAKGVTGKKQKISK